MSPLSMAQDENFDHTSHLVSLIDQIETVLNSPEDFTSSTAQSILPPLLSQINDYDVSEQLEERVFTLEKWCRQLSDATRAAETRETIIGILNEVENWDEWTWNRNVIEVEEKKSRVTQIKRILAELPIEWLKSRITGLPPFPSNRSFLFLIVVILMLLCCRLTKEWRSITS